MGVISTGSANSGGIVLAHVVVVVPSSLLSPAIDRTIYLHLPPLLTHDACHVLHKCHRCVTASSSNLYWYLVKCAMRLSAAFQKKLYTSVVLCGIAAARGIRYRDHVLDAVVVHRRGNPQEAEVGNRLCQGSMRGRGGGGGEGKGRTARCEVIWGVVESSRQCCVF